MANLDDTDIDFMRAVARFGGEDVTTTTIRRETGFSRHTTRYRFGKLENKELIQVDEAESSQGGGSPPNTATLTERGRQVLARVGDGDDEEEDEENITDEERLKRIEERLDRLEARVDIATGSLADLEDQHEQMMGWMGLAEVYLRAARRVFENDLNIDFEQVMKEIDEGKD